MLFSLYVKFYGRWSAAFVMNEFFAKIALFRILKHLGQMNYKLFIILVLCFIIEFRRLTSMVLLSEKSKV